MLEQEQNGRFFRAAWITGINKYYPGIPKESYTAPWETMVQWEQESSKAVFEQVHQFVSLADGSTTHLSREHKGRFVYLCWLAQIFKHISKPKPSYIVDWEQLPVWQRETNGDIFEAIERLVMHKDS